MQRDRNFLRAAPVSFWSSAPNLQVSIFSLAVTAKAGAPTIGRANTAAANTYRSIVTPSAKRHPGAGRYRCIKAFVGPPALVALLQTRQRVAREVLALLDHELEQERRAGLGHADRLLDRRHDVLGL